MIGVIELCNVENIIDVCEKPPPLSVPEEFGDGTNTIMPKQNIGLNNVKY